MVLERILLQTIKFDLQVEHPYQFLLKYAKQLKGDKNKIQKLVQMAWTFVNDSLCTTLSLQWEPEIIAVAVMYLAGRLCKFEIQEWTSKPMYRRWWEQFVQDVPVDVLEDICHQILDLYSQGKQQMPHHTPHQLQQPPSLHPAPQVPQVPQSQSSQGSEAPQPPQKDPQQPAQPQPPPPAQPPKKPSPQPSPPRQAKRAVVSVAARHWARPPVPADPCLVRSPVRELMGTRGREWRPLLTVCLRVPGEPEDEPGWRSGATRSQDSSVLLQPLLPHLLGPHLLGWRVCVCALRAGISVPSARRG